MPYYFKKSIKAGPFRFNLSKSGIGISAGITGLRIGTGPRGHYIHAGRKGVYYRKSLSNIGAKKTTRDNPRPKREDASDLVSEIVMTEIDSGSVLDMEPEKFPIYLMR